MNKFSLLMFFSLMLTGHHTHAQTPPTPPTQDVADEALQTDNIPKNSHHPDSPTLAEIQAPSESELSRANVELLAKNAELENRVDELTTQVNVLVNERSGQIFLYGVFSVIFSFAGGFMLAWAIHKKKTEW